mmetsp:Transcript_29331/g.94637  ORF Transcript_29331/g.94637 Transcript_29331/m.94637 type:complete len:128 (+) Transcript_29331:50-433(+)
MAASEVEALSSSEDQVVLLVTSMPSTSIIEGNQNVVRQAFRGRKIKFVELDGMDQAKKETRNRLFGISEKRGVFPQVFTQIDGDIAFIGDFDTLNSLNDCDALPPDVLEANPQIQTITSVFKRFIAD